MKTILLSVLTILMSHSFAFAKSITVSGNGSSSSFCNANSGTFCYNNIKRQSESDSERDARWTCEMTNRGRSLSYTSYTSTHCSPSYLPPNHDGTWVHCRSNTRMQCEVQN